jgi:signal transduction histidine kinase
MRKVRSLRVRFVLAIAALVAVVLVANGLVMALASRPHLRQDIEGRAQAYAQLAVGPICNAYETYYGSGYSKFRELLLETMRLEPDLARLSIYDTAGRLLFDTKELQGSPRDPVLQPPASYGGEAMRHALKSMSPSAWTESPPSGLPYYVVVAPYVEEWGRHRYSVAFSFLYGGLQTAAKAMGWRIALLSVGALALGVLIAILLASQSVGPLEILTRGAQDLADGRLERRIELGTGDEFGVLAQAFNQMAEKLARTIADLEASNRTLGQLNLDLQQLDRLKSDLLANVSHELRTPLTAIQGYTEAMDDGLLGRVNDQQRDAFQVVQRNITRLLGMIEQLLTFARLEAGVAKLECAAFDLGEAAEHVVAAVLAARDPHLVLLLEVQPGLPPVWADPGRISQVIENLVTNAVKFTPPGADIRVMVRACEHEAEVVVADRGVGIPPAALAKIFERFYQVDATSTRRYGGMGLGLAIVREILAAHQREIHVESALNVGTTFRFTLPFAGARARERKGVRGIEAPSPAIAG